MLVAGPTAPLRIGVVGLDRIGAYHLERLSLRDDIQVVATHDPDPARAATLPPCAGEYRPRWESLLENPAVELVLLPAGTQQLRTPQALQALDAGRHVALTVPLAGSTAEADALLDTARRSGRVLAALPFHRWNDDFRTAAGELESGSLGRLRSAKCLLWQYRAGAEQLAPLDAVGPELLDQMLRIFDAPPQDVTARVALSSEGRQTGFTLALGFGDDRSGLLDVDFAAIAPHRSGWVLQGTKGAWQNFRRYTRTDEDEIYETPIEPLPTFWDGAYAELLRLVRETKPGEIPAVTQQARLVVELLDAARESADTGRTVALASRAQS
jgi:predicted dehydrogenase